MSINLCRWKITHDSLWFFLTTFQVSILIVQPHRLVKNSECLELIQTVWKHHQPANNTVSLTLIKISWKLAWSSLFFQIIVTRMVNVFQSNAHLVTLAIISQTVNWHQNVHRNIQVSCLFTDPTKVNIFKMNCNKKLLLYLGTWPNCNIYATTPRNVSNYIKNNLKNDLNRK